MRVHLLFGVLKSAFWIDSSVLCSNRVWFLLFPQRLLKQQSATTGILFIWENLQNIDFTKSKMSARSIFELQLSHGFNILSFLSANDLQFSDAVSIWPQMTFTTGIKMLGNRWSKQIKEYNTYVDKITLKNAGLTPVDVFYDS